MLQVSALYIYPIKSLGGISLTHAQVTDRGLQLDRRWMLVNEAGVFLSQRQLPQMALLQVNVEHDGLSVVHKKTGASIAIPFQLNIQNETPVTVWDSRSTAHLVGAAYDVWFSEQLGVACRLVHMPESNPIPVDPEYAHRGEVTSFSDGYPFLLIGQSSLDELNSRLKAPVPMNRFRPNIVVAGAAPFAEDGWQHFTIGGVHFYGVKRCGRCLVTTIRQDEGIAGKEPLQTLAGYRKDGTKIYFGQNLLHQGTGTIKVGDAVQLL
ncbi:MOSC domain-containing protein [Paracnuella aquatica]|uniref:MOSC domain-containing protein n=1 Tax=Paracnuella aquatica TaxID=2268757 RepID=UPI000DEFD5A3|nr:MOSC N-terminal beta barrel domain-containing protein [Paracnuella aquatica]RPD44813.1 MOSC domain-containing protein [Paracnuella aquatica]